MGAIGVTPEVIATIVVVLVIAVAMLLLYFVCRSDDPARDHTCVAWLYPRTRRELQQLRIPLEPAQPTDIHVNQGYEGEAATQTQHSIQVNGSPGNEKPAQEAAPPSQCIVTVHATPQAQPSGSEHSGEPTINADSENATLDRGAAGCIAEQSSE